MASVRQSGEREPAREQLLLSAWDGASAALSKACGVDTADADAWLAKAFGWSMWITAGQPEYLRSRTEVPDADRLEHDLRWLAEGPLGLNQEELRHVAMSCPRRALFAPAKHYAKALESAPPQFSGQEAFRKLLIADPKILELEVNCDGGCNARCA
eukprot:CAMPEP_0170576416 /NCGR_PEP_ID=MMETSP0224-20130122/4379_1 /TAXON_ID=285029 /ORGANISM="Togula jolla, Strain CCCM 725" /LENGTH=155 /DNA_ID=CAMNT_0010899253 /DNA_START=174 /DNA_END=637 /DNA_ORIENTATION=-